jgi:hypothetical protein
MSISSAPADDLGISVSGDMADFRALDNGASSGTAAPRVISPPGVPGDVADVQHGDDTAVVRENIPSQHLCPMIQEPPFDAVHSVVPIANGTILWLV